MHVHQFPHKISEVLVCLHVLVCNQRTYETVAHALIDINHTCTSTNQMYDCASVLATSHPVSAVSHDVQRPISHHRSLRHGARWTTFTGDNRVWRMWQEVHGEIKHEATSCDSSWRRWRRWRHVRSLLACLQTKGLSCEAFKGCT